MTLLAAFAIAAATAEGTVPATPPFRASLTASTHTPRVGRPWYYTVRVTNRNGRPIAAQVVPVVRSGNRNIDTVGFFQIYGVCGHPYQWQRVHRGKRLVFQVRVRAEGALVRLNYWIRVR